MSTYPVGTTVRLRTEVRDADDALVTPGALTLTVLLPDGTTDGPLPPSATGTGLFQYDYPTVQAGRHVARWVSTSPTATQEEVFDVAAQWAQAGLVSLDDAKRQLNITSDTEDAELAEMIRAVTAVVERHTGAVLRRTVVEQHAGGYALALRQLPVVAVTSIAGLGVGGLDVAPGDVLVDGLSGVVCAVDGRWIAGPVLVTYTAGQAMVPPNVRLAALIILQHLWETQRGGSRDTRFTGGGDETWNPGMGFAIPRRALELLGDQVSGIA